MSLMTSSVKIGLRPRTSFRLDTSAMPRLSLPSDDELLLARLEVVVVVEHLPAHELLQWRRVSQTVDPELALDELGIPVGPLALDAVEAERFDVPGDVQLTVVHRVPEVGADVPEDDLSAPLHHEAGVRPGVAADDDRAALLVDPRAGPDRT